MLFSALKRPVVSQHYNTKWENGTIQSLYLYPSFNNTQHNLQECKRRMKWQCGWLLDISLSTVAQTVST